MVTIDNQTKKKTRLKKEITALNKIIDNFHNEIDSIDAAAAKAKTLLLEKQHQLDTIYDKE